MRAPYDVSLGHTASGPSCCLSCLCRCIRPLSAHCQVSRIPLTRIGCLLTTSEPRFNSKHSFPLRLRRCSLSALPRCSIVLDRGGLGFRSILTESRPIARPSIPLAQPFPAVIEGLCAVSLATLGNLHTVKSCSTPILAPHVPQHLSCVNSFRWTRSRWVLRHQPSPC